MISAERYSSVGGKKKGIDSDIRERDTVRVQEWEWTISTTRAKVFSPSFILVRILQFPYENVRKCVESKGGGVTHSIANLSLSSKVLISS
jgi:hypothetical protein